jgi:hypothetical protein
MSSPSSFRQLSILVAADDEEETLAVRFVIVGRKSWEKSAAEAKARVSESPAYVR